MELKKAVINGATSMIGIATVREFLKNNIPVIAVVREGTNRLGRLPKSDLLQVEYCDLSHMKTYEPRIHDADVFYHFAWNATLKNAGRFDVESQEPNIRYTLDAVRLAQRFGCRKFVGAGSQAEYGPQDSIIMSDTPIRPVMAYGVAKFAAGRLASILCESIGMNFVWGRILSVYGPHDNPDTLVRYVLDCYQSGTQPELTPCEQVWDYLYEEDAGRAFYAMGASEKAKGVYCVGSGTGRPLKEYVKEIYDLVNPKEMLVFGGKSYGNNPVMHLEADISRLRKDTGWTPRVSFAVGVKNIIEYEKNLSERRMISFKGE